MSLLRPMLVVLMLLLGGAALAQDLPRVPPEEVGLSPERLERVGRWLQAEIDGRKIPGAVLLIARQGKVAYFESFGRRDGSTDVPMARDALFRIYSMTKPIASVAAMMLVEDGRLALDDPVARYIPEFASVSVGVEKPGQSGADATLERVPARRPVTVHDLLRHTSGLTYGFFGDTPVKRAYRAAGVDPDANDSLSTFASRLAALPLHFQPGSTWDYGVSTDLLGRVIEVAGGMPLSQFLKTRLLDPLGMKDTSFYVTEPARQARLAEPLPDDRVLGIGAVIGNPRVARRAESAGGGLISSATDYARFALMLRNGGELNGRRILGPRTVEFMTSDHLGSAIARTPLYLPGPGYGFGLGFAVRTATGEAAAPGAPGEYYWGGAAGTYFWVDPRNDLVVVFMIQSPRQRAAYRTILRNMIYAAISR
ncbi:MAG: beta-lactamase family protein [Burkholderiaceae bacterium]|nr:beta-lactamase family protein [Burkholderiaceae bacterium]